MIFIRIETGSIKYGRNTSKMEGELKDYPQTSGGIAPTMQQQIPEIETVTRYTSFGDWTFTMTDTKMKYSGRCIIADSCFFDILPRPMLIGNAKEVLSTPMYVLVSSRIAKNIGGDVIGKNFTVDSSPGRTMTIGGVLRKFRKILIPVTM